MSASYQCLTAVEMPASYQYLTAVEMPDSYQRVQHSGQLPADVTRKLKVEIHIR